MSSVPVSDFTRSKSQLERVACMLPVTSFKLSVLRADVDELI